MSDVNDNLPTSSLNVQLHLPGTDAAEFKADVVPYPKMLGTWHVIASTLPLWKDKKNVTISYSPLPGEPQTTFDDLVSYNKKSDAVGKTPSVVKGISRLQPDTGARWKWRGKKWLILITSNWQLLGYSLPSSPDEPSWVVTYFQATLFTPAGLDIYTRGAKGLSDSAVEQLVGALKGLGGEIEGLCKDGGMFRIPHD